MNPLINRCQKPPTDENVHGVDGFFKYQFKGFSYCKNPTVNLYIFVIETFNFSPEVNWLLKELFRERNNLQKR